MESLERHQRAAVEKARAADPGASYRPRADGFLELHFAPKWEQGGIHRVSKLYVTGPCRRFTIRVHPNSPPGRPSAVCGHGWKYCAARQARRDPKNPFRSQSDDASNADPTRCGPTPRLLVLPARPAAHVRTCHPPSRTPSGAGRCLVANNQRRCRLPERRDFPRRASVIGTPEYKVSAVRLERV